MTYLELINNADYKLSHNQITFGEYSKMIEPLRTEIPKKGKWIHWTDDYKDYCTCSKCGYGEEGELLLKNITPFCPYCGSYNGGEEDETDN